MVAKSKKYLIFLEALLVAGFIFSFGILTGIFIENARVNAIQENYAQLETEILDARILSTLISESECQLAIQENINFADRVFWEARLLDKYEQANEITEAIRTQHKKYDLLRTIIWMNSIEIKKRCDAGYHNVVYLYEYKNPSISKRAEQSVISNILMDIKEAKQDQVLLISIAADIEASSIELIKQKYSITQLPTILIDEQTKITEITSKEDIEKYLL